MELIYKDLGNGVCRRKLLLFLLFAIFGVSVVYAQGEERRCYSFTWLGPKYSNLSIIENATCQDATRLTAGVPCRQPLVASFDGSWPDVDYIWRNHREATCVIAENSGSVCAQYTYYFDGRPENSTYMCTRAIDTLGGAITSGCYQQTIGSSSTRVCFCQSISGRIPCNSASYHYPFFTVFGLTAALLLLNISKT